MFNPRTRMAMLAVLTVVAVALSACRAKDRVADRRAKAEREAAVSAPLDGGDFWAEGAAEPENTDDAAMALADDPSGAATRPAGDAVRPAGDELDALPPIDDEPDLTLLDDPARDAPAGDAGARARTSTPPDDSEAARILADMRRDDEVNRETAKWWEAKGDEAFRQGAHNDASEAYRKSLDSSHSDEVHKKWNQTLLLLGEREAEIVAIPDAFLDSLRVAEEQIKDEIRINLGLAKKKYESGDLDEAYRAARVALDMMQANPRLVIDSQRAAGEKLLKDIEIRQNEVDSEKHLARIRDAEIQIQKQLIEEDVRRKNQVQDLLFTARRHIRLKEYRQAQEACESVLQIEPDNRVATHWRQVSRDQLYNMERLRLQHDRIDSAKLSQEIFLNLGTPVDAIDFPVDEKWQRVIERSKRARGAILEEPESNRIIRNRLESQMIQDINFDETPLSEVIETFRTIAGVNMILDSNIAGDAPEFAVTQQITNLSALSALTLILESKNLGYAFEDNAMVISSSADINVATTFEVYNVQDLLTKIRDFHAPEIRLKGANETTGADSPISFTEETVEEEDSLDPEALIELIQQTTGGEEVWSDQFPIDVSRGQLFVNAPPDLQQKVQGVLASLREDSDLFVIIEARFIDVFDDFLEDIGVDSRSLGLVNNRGTAFGNVINDSRTGGNDLGIVQQGDQEDVFLVQGLDRWAGRVQHIIDGFAGTIRGDRLTAGNGLSGGTFQATWLEPFQVNVILRMVQEKQDVRQLTAPVVTAHNNERVYVSVITQRAYIADYELVSGGTGFSIIEVADPVIQTFQEGVILDVDPTISHDKKYVTLDVRPTLATLIGGVISTINISLGSFTNVAFQVPIGIPQISLQQSFTSVTVPNGGTVLLGGFKSMDQGKFVSYLPVLGHIPILKNLARRKATISEKRSLVILLSARIVDLRGEEAQMFNRDD